MALKFFNCATISCYYLTLKQKVDEFFSRYSHIPSKQKIYAKFDRTLFSQDFESLSFYLKEIRQCLTQLEKINDDNVQKYTFYSEKLKDNVRLSQRCCRCIAKQTSNFSITIQVCNLYKSGGKNKELNILNKSSSKERLSKYYEALQALNTKLGTMNRLL